MVKPCRHVARACRAWHAGDNLAKALGMYGGHGHLQLELQAEKPHVP